MGDFREGVEGDAGVCHGGAPEGALVADPGHAPNHGGAIGDDGAHSGGAGADRLTADRFRWPLGPVLVYLWGTISRRQACEAQACCCLRHRGGVHFALDLRVLYRSAAPAMFLVT